MHKHRIAAKVDINQPGIVERLREIPGVEVEVGHDDILVGYKGLTYWFEIKNESTVSKKTGKILESAIKPDQKRIRSTFTGHYEIVYKIEQILETLNVRG